MQDVQSAKLSLNSPDLPLPSLHFSVLTQTLPVIPCSALPIPIPQLLRNLQHPHFQHLTRSQHLCYTQDQCWYLRNACPSSQKHNAQNQDKGTRNLKGCSFYISIHMKHRDGNFSTLQPRALILSMSTFHVLHLLHLHSPPSSPPSSLQLKPLFLSVTAPKCHLLTPLCISPLFLSFCGGGLKSNRLKHFVKTLAEHADPTNLLLILFWLHLAPLFGKHQHNPSFYLSLNL